jgi:LEA14-like dessication related protein
MKPKILLLAILFISNFTYAVKTPEIKSIISNEIIKFENATIYLLSKVEIHNPNLVPLNFEKISMSFNDKRKKYADGTSSGEVFLAANKSKEVSFEIKIYLDSMSSELINDFITKDSVKLNGKVSGVLGLLKIKISEKLEFSLDSRQLLEPLKKEFIKNTNVNTSAIKLLEADLNKIRLQVPVIIKNTFPFELKVIAIDIKMFSDASYKTKVGEVNDKTEIILQAEKETTIEKELSINTIQGGLSGLLKAVQREFDYYIMGNIIVVFGKQELTVPLKEKIVVDPINGTVK